MTMEKIKTQLESGKTPRELIGSGYPKSSVYAVQKKLRDKEAAVQGEKDELAARLFKMFDEKKSPCDAVIEEEIRPEVAQNYFEKWRQLSAYSPLDMKPRLLWFIFSLNLRLCFLLDQMREKLRGSPSFERLMPDPKFELHFKEGMVEAITYTSMFAMDHARAMLEASKEILGWNTLEEFYPLDSEPNMKILKKIWLTSKQ